MHQESASNLHVCHLCIAGQRLLQYSSSFSNPVSDGQVLLFSVPSFLAELESLNCIQV